MHAPLNKISTFRSLIHATSISHNQTGTLRSITQTNLNQIATFKPNVHDDLNNIYAVKSKCPPLIKSLL